MLYDSFYDMDKFINQSSDSYTPFILVCDYSFLVMSRILKRRLRSIPTTLAFV